MQKLNSGSGFVAFLSSGDKKLWFGIIAAACALLMLVGSVGLSKDTESESTLEDKTAKLCSSVEGVGECSVMITYDKDGDVYAVAVLCEGADSLSVEEKIKSMAASLFGIGTNRITVLKISK